MKVNIACGQGWEPLIYELSLLTHCQISGPRRLEEWDRKTKSSTVEYKISYGESKPEKLSREVQKWPLRLELV